MVGFQFGRRSMYKLIICVLLIISNGMFLSANSTNRSKKLCRASYIYRYTLKDKNGSSFTLDHPSKWLSHKSIERRNRQGLALDSTDLPVSSLYLKQLNQSIRELTRQHEGKVEAKVIGSSRWNNTVLVLSDDTLLLNRLASLSFVKDSRKVWTSPDSTSKDHQKVKSHDIFNPWDSIGNEYYGNAKEQIEMLHGQRLHRIGFDGRGMTIAVLDEGFQNVDVIPSMQTIDVIGVHDFVYPNSRHFYRESDHGTKVLSVMALKVPNVLVGTAPDARFWLLRCEDGQSEQPVEEDYWTMAAEFADSAGVDIINSSIGYHAYDDDAESYHQRALDGRTALISRSASMLARKGIVLVNSAGNTGMEPWKKIIFPADAQDIITVGAVNSDLKNVPFSGVGPTQDGRVKPDVMALGSATSVLSGRGTIVRDMGTSFSAPIVAGLTACLWQAFPTMRAIDIIELVRKTGSNYTVPDNIYGYGIPNFWKAYMIGKSEMQHGKKLRKTDIIRTQ